MQALKNTIYAERGNPATALECMRSGGGEQKKKLNERSKEAETLLPLQINYPTLKSEGSFRKPTSTPSVRVQRADGCIVLAPDDDPDDHAIRVYRENKLITSLIRGIRSTD